MTDKAKNFDISLNSSAKTVSSVVYTLELPNLFRIPKYPDMFDADSEDSPTFGYANATWCFRFYPGERPSVSFEKYFDVSLVRKTSKVMCHKIFYTITLQNKSGRKYDDFYNVDVFDKDNLEHAVAHFFDQSQSQKRKKRSKKDDTLELICELFSDESVKKGVVSNQDLPNTSNKDVEMLCQDFNELFMNGQNHDLILRVTDKEFRVHRSILMARSKVFEAMFTHDTTEKKNGTVDIPDCEPQAMEQFLMYIYCGKVQCLNQDYMLGLYYAADKYNMPLLKEDCSEFIKKSLSSSNICDVIQLALNHNDPDMLDCATRYFMNHTSEILPTEGWMSFIKLNFIAANKLLMKASKKWDSDK